MVAPVVQTTVMAEVAALTNVGLLRPDNEDCCLVLDVTTGQNFLPSHPNDTVGMARFAVGPLGLLLVVADGVGGNRGGADASRIVCETLRDSALRRLPTVGDDRGSIEAALAAMLTEANREVRAQADRGVGGDDMASTAVVLYLRGAFVHLANVGDSRIYLARRGRIVQRTIDQIVPTPAGTERRNDDLLQAVGWEPVVEPAFGIGQVHSRDVYLLCSDGVSNELSDVAMQEIIAANRHSSRGCAEVLVHRALQMGGRDNMTCIALTVAMESAGEAPATMLDVQDGRSEPAPPLVRRAATEAEYLEKRTDWM